MILAIDPGNIESAYVFMEDDLRPVFFGKVKNEELLSIINQNGCLGHDFAIEMVASYGMPVGAEVFETVFWIGRFWQAAEDMRYRNMKKIYRMEEKINLCHDSRAKDANIICALIDRFAKNSANHGKGSKSSPGWFYGFKSDIWQAYSVAVTYHDLYLKTLGAAR